MTKSHNYFLDKLYLPERDYFRNAYARDAGLRIDHFLLSPSIKHRLLAGSVDRHVRRWEKSSDHGPVWIELSDAGKG